MMANTKNGFLDYQVPANGILLQAREYAQDGPPLLLLHFGGGSLAMWEGVTPYFADRCRLLLVDLRGHGRSDKPHGGYHIDDMAADVAALLAARELPPAHVVGSQLGAEVGLALAAQWPERVRSLTCEGALCQERGRYGPGEDGPWTAPADCYPTPEALRAVTRRAFAARNCWNERVAALVEYDICQTLEGEFTRCWRPWAQQAYREQNCQVRLEGYLRRVRCPLLLLPAGARASEAARALAALTPNGRVVEVAGARPGSGWLLDPEPLCRAVRARLDEVEAGERAAG